jgi:hypothetical protein
VGQGVGGRPADADGMPGSTRAAAASAIVLLGLLERDLAHRARTRHADERRRAAVDLLEEASIVEDLGSRRTVMSETWFADQLGDGPPDLAHAFEDEGLTLPGEHHRSTLGSDGAVRHAHLATLLCRTKIAVTPHESQRNPTRSLPNCYPESLTPQAAMHTIRVNLLDFVGQGPEEEQLWPNPSRRVPSPAGRS